MDRRTVLRTAGAGFAALGTGCLGTGGEVVVSVQQDVIVEPQDAWTTELPDVSESGGELEYRVRSETPFDVYFFVDESNFEQYDAYLKGEEPESTPAGEPTFSQTAIPREGSEIYEASTDDGGAREPVEAEGPYYFAVDHTSYRMETRVGEFDDRLTAFVDLKLVEGRSLL